MIANDTATRVTWNTPTLRSGRVAIIVLSVPWSVTGCTARAIARRCGSCVDPSQSASGAVLSVNPRL
jgi:hypothetical protein